MAPILKLFLNYALILSLSLNIKIIFKNELGFFKYIILSILVLTFFSFFIINLNLINFYNNLIYLIFAINICTNLFFVNKIRNNNERENIFFYFFILILICLFSFKLEIYKSDDFGRYAYYTKFLIENNFPYNVFFLNKFNINEINIISYLHFFFLKFLNIKYNENIIFIVNNSLILLLFFSTLEFVKIKIFSKKAIYLFFIFFLLSYILLSGFDRLYLESIQGILFIYIFILLINANSDKEKVNLNQLILIILLINFFFFLKPSSSYFIVIFCIYFFIFNFFDKPKKKLINSIIIFVMTIAMCVLIQTTNRNYYKINIASYNKISDSKIKINTISDDKKLFKNYINEINYSSNKYLLKLYRIKKVTIEKLSTFEFTNTEKQALKKFYNSLKKDGVYHAYFFNNIKNILEYFKLNINFPKFPMTIYFWIIFIFFLYKIFKPKILKSEISILILTFITYNVFYILYLFSSPKLNFLNHESYGLDWSWHRHNGVFIFSLIFLFILFETNFHKKLIVYLTLFLLTLLPARAISKSVPIYNLLSVNERNISIKKKYIKEKILKIKNNITEENILLLASLKKSDSYDKYIYKYLMSEYKFDNIRIKKLNNLKKINNIFQNYHIYLISDYLLDSNNVAIIDNLYLYKVKNLNELKKYLNY